MKAIGLIILLIGIISYFLNQSEIDGRIIEIKKEVLDFIFEVMSKNEEHLKNNSTVEDSKRALEYLNRVRAEHGYSPLKFDLRAYNLAMARVRDMYEYHYFDHVNPYTKLSPADLKFEYGFSTSEHICENIFLFVGGYFNGLEESAIDSWMVSKGHKRNLLQSKAGAVACFEYYCVFIGLK